MLSNFRFNSSISRSISPAKCSPGGVAALKTLFIVIASVQNLVKKSSLIKTQKKRYKFRLVVRNTIFWYEIRIMVQNSIFCYKVWFLIRKSIFWYEIRLLIRNSIFCNEIWFLIRNSIFWYEIRFFDQNSIFWDELRFNADNIFNVKFWSLVKIQFFRNFQFLLRQQVCSLFRFLRD